ncbi:hypothetical protein DB346_18930 [Verrucomicrobia bacterium LW23]|nr:hypothetical protein DB346_18930 [Verrucomicrobia bacterium LW23]
MQAQYAILLMAIAVLCFLVFRLWKAREQYYVVTGLCAFIALICIQFAIEVVDSLSLNITTGLLIIGYFVTMLAIAERDHV